MIFTTTGPFHNLLREILNRIGDMDISNIKNYFKEVVNSTRGLSEIKTLEDLINTLLDRDAIWETNIDMLENLVKLLASNKPDCGYLLCTLSTYKKLNCESPAKCSFCQAPIEFIIPDVQLESQEILQIPPSAPEHDDVEDDEIEFTQISNFLSINLGHSWRKLATKLQLEQGTIDSLEDRYNKNLEERIYAMLQCWKQQHGDKANKEVLIHKLQSVPVYRKDLAQKLLKGAHKIC